MRPVSGLLDLLQQVVCMCNKSKHVCDNAAVDIMPKPKATKTTQPAQSAKKPVKSNPVAFTVHLDEGSSKKGKSQMPARFKHKTEGRPMTPDFVQKKQEEAEARRREFQENRLQKIKDTTGEAKKVNRQPAPQAV